MCNQVLLAVYTVLLLLCGITWMGDDDMPSKQKSLSQDNQNTQFQQERLQEDIDKRELEREFRRDKDQLGRISQAFEEFPRLTELADASSIRCIRRRLFLLRQGGKVAGDSEGGSAPTA